MNEYIYVLEYYLTQKIDIPENEREVFIELFSSGIDCTEKTEICERLHATMTLFVFGQKHITQIEPFKSAKLTSQEWLHITNLAVRFDTIVTAFRKDAHNDLIELFISLRNGLNK